jgi:hypothetical protein
MFKYVVKIKFKKKNNGYSMPAQWIDYGRNGEPSEPSEWCMENVGLRGYAWKRMESYGMILYVFVDPDLALMFKLRWGDY